MLRWWFEYRNHGLKKKEARLQGDIAFFEKLVGSLDEDSSRYEILRGSIYTLYFQLAEVRERIKKIQQRLQPA